MSQGSWLVSLSHPWNLLAVEVAIKLHELLQEEDESVVPIYGFIGEAQAIVEWCSTNLNDLEADALVEQITAIFKEFMNQEYDPTTFKDAAEFILKRINSVSFRQVYLI